MINNFLKPVKGDLRKFLLKAVPLAALIAVGVTYIGERYTIGVDPQAVTCLGKRIFIVDHFDIAPVRGNIYQFKARNMTPYFANETPIVKVVSGVPGDRIRVTEGGVWVNGVTVAEGLGLLEKLKKPASRFKRDEYLADGKYWATGSAPESYDSRYWGTVDHKQIVGRAYPIW